MCSAGVPRVLDLGGNTFSGPFPTALVAQAEAAQSACANMCSVRLLLNGTDMALACPDQLQVSQAQLAFLQQADYVCSDGSGKQVRRLARLAGWCLVCVCVWEGLWVCMGALGSGIAQHSNMQAVRVCMDRVCQAGGGAGNRHVCGAEPDGLLVCMLKLSTSCR